MFYQVIPYIVEDTFKNKPKVLVYYCWYIHFLTFQHKTRLSKFLVN